MKGSMKMAGLFMKHGKDGTRKELNKSENGNRLNMNGGVRCVLAIDGRSGNGSSGMKTHMNNGGSVYVHGKDGGGIARMEILMKMAGYPCL